jgi:hypothetical protein
MWREGEVERWGRHRIWRETGEGGDDGRGGRGERIRVLGGRGAGLYRKGRGGVGRRGLWAADPIMLCREPNKWLPAKNFSKTF